MKKNPQMAFILKFLQSFDKGSNFLVRQRLAWVSQQHIPKLKLQTQIKKMMLRVQDRQEQRFLSKSGHINEGLTSCCQFFQAFQDKSSNIYQKSKNQQKISLKKVSQATRKEENINKSNLFSSQITRNIKKNELRYHPAHAILSIPQESIFTPNQPYMNQARPFPHPLLVSCKSQQNLHSFAATSPSHIKFKPVTFQFTNNPHRKAQQPISTVQSLSHFEVTSTKDVQKIDQTTCLEHQSQLSLSQNLKSRTQLNRFSSTQQKLLENQEETPLEGQDQWSDESLSSQTNLRFEQIDEEQSISDSTSMHHKNIVIVNHGSHPQIFQEFRKAHTIRSNLSHDDDNFSGHSIVLDKQHAFFVTPQKRYERNENRHFSYGDF